MDSKNFASNTMSTSQSRLKNETKDKFEILLKQALISKSHKNAHNQVTRKLTPDIESLTSSNENMPAVNYKTQLNVTHKSPAHVTETVEVDVHEDFQKDNFILNKFLNDTKQMKDVEVNDTQDSNEVIAFDANNSDVILFSKPPIPRPRKSKLPIEDCSSPSSAGTYKITSKEPELNLEVSKIIKSNSDDSSNISLSNSVKREKTLSKRRPSSSTKTSEDEMIKSNTELDQIKYENEVKPKHKRKSTTPRQTEIFKNVAETVLGESKYTYEKIIGITVHKTDRLKLDSLVIHPVVKIHIVDKETGKYLKKSDRNRPVVFYYENKDITYITPIISEPYNLYEQQSLYPAWEETVMINEDINLLTETETNAIIFFEVLDFVSFSVAHSQFNQKGSSKGWHKIAWAFLKPLGKDNQSNINKKARLQLYYPGKHKKVLPDICDIFHWWNNKKLLKYPASLYISVKGIIPPEEIILTLRSKTPIHGEKGSRTIFGTEPQVPSIQSISSGKIDEDIRIDSGKQTEWSRANYQICKLPNKCVAELQSFEEGCLMLKFSNNGLYLACAVLIDNVHSIIIFSVKTHEELSRYSGHQGLIYDINWSKDDQFILTASADCTACIWSFPSNMFVEMLPHPSYVYTSEISVKNVIATGCYDHIIRIWCKANNEMSYNLFQELEGHKGYVTSLCFNSKSVVLYSSDAKGTIIEWKYKTSDNIWNLKREIKVPDLRDTIINQILLHTRERRLLIHARDNALRIIDVKTGCVLYWLQGAVNNRIKTTCSFSPCGNFIFAGSENGCINVWNSDLGQSVASYGPYDAFNYQNLAVHCVQFHPHDNILAVSHYGHNLPVLLILYDAALEGKSNVGLKLLQNDDELNVLQKSSKLKSLGNLKETVRKIITESGDGDDEKKTVKIKFEDVIQKIDEIVSVSRPSASASSKSSTYN